MMARSGISKLRYNKLLNEGFILPTGTDKKEPDQEELCVTPKNYAWHMTFKGHQRKLNLKGKGDY